MMSITNRWTHNLLTAALVTALAAGCTSDAAPPPDEPSTAGNQDVTLAASADTTARLGIASWHYAPTADAVVVRGRAGDASEVARFWLSAGANADELIARATDTDAQAVVLHEGGVRSDDPALRDQVAAFRADVEAAPADKQGKPQQVGDSVYFCQGSQGTFSTWAFWRPTYIQVSNPSTAQWIQLSMQAGASQEYQWVQPTGALFTRYFWGLPVTIRYESHYPDYLAALCPVQVSVI